MLRNTNQRPKVVVPSPSRTRRFVTRGGQTTSQSKLARESSRKAPRRERSKTKSEVDSSGARRCCAKRPVRINDIYRMFSFSSAADTENKLLCNCNIGIRSYITQKWFQLIVENH